MKLLRANLQHTIFTHGVVATIGNFDGVHLGHQNLINSLKTKANSLNLPLVVILFEPQPKEFFSKTQAPARLSSLREKLEVLKKLNIDYIYCIKFDAQFAQTSAADFAEQHLFKTLNIHYLLLGADFRFGKNREGDFALLKTLGAKHHCEIQPYQDFLVDHERVSSTKIRNALEHNEFELAAKFLGRPYSMCARVIKGDGRGRQWGIPTANVSLKRLTLPLHGVFAVTVRIADRIIQGVANIGKRPTIDGSKNILEIHLFDFNESIYGSIIQVFFLHKLRDEVKFTSIDNLIAQIHQDIAASKAFFNTKVNLQKLNDFAE